MLKKKYLETLNSEQLKAVNYHQGSLYILAGAGTGKTKTLTHRIAYLIDELKISSHQILAITFTNNATKEMETRLQTIIPDNLAGLTICTFHSLACRILRQNIAQLNLDFSPTFSIIDEQDTKKIIKNIIKKKNLDPDRYKTEEIKNYISKKKITDCEKEIQKKLSFWQEQNLFILSSSHNPEHNLQQIEKNYQQELQQQNLLDFDDLLIYTYQLLKTKDSVRNYYQQKFPYILVDEFQDISLLQYTIIKIIGAHSTIFAVGDPNQNIYSFRGAQTLCSTMLQKDFNAPLLILKKNYRSTSNILDKANLLINYNYHHKNNNNNFKNKLESTCRVKYPVIYKNFFHSSQETSFIIKQIQKLVLSGNYRYSDFGILYRTNVLSREIENQLVLNQIPYLISQQTIWLQKKEIKDFLAYLKIITDTQKDFYIKRIINVPSRKIGTKTIAKLEQIATDHQISFFEAIIYFSRKKNKKNPINHFLKIFQILKDLVNNIEKCSLSNLILQINDIIQYSKSLANEDTEKQAKVLANINRLQEILIQINNTTTGTVLEKLNIFLEKMDLNNVNTDNAKNKIILSSIHKAKGLEFRVVFSIGWEQGIFLENNEYHFSLPNTNNKNKQMEEKKLLEEERRIAYVAITRAKEMLYISSARKRILFGQEITFQPVCFLKEMGLFTENKKSSFISTQQLLKKNIFISHGYRTGDKVFHTQFGKGIIINIKKDIIDILFEKENCIKKISSHHKSLTKQKK